MPLPVWQLKKHALCLTIASARWSTDHTIYHLFYFYIISMANSANLAYSLFRDLFAPHKPGASTESRKRNDYHLASETDLLQRGGNGRFTKIPNRKWQSTLRRIEGEIVMSRSHAEKASRSCPDIAPASQSTTSKSPQIIFHRYFVYYSGRAIAD